MFNKCNKIIAVLIIIVVLLNICFSQFFTPRTYAENNNAGGDMIAQASRDENRELYGGKPGDQKNDQRRKSRGKY